MKNIDDLMESARELQDRGLKTGEIADELNVSRETVNWLLSQDSGEGEEVPSDIHVDWSAIGGSSERLSLVSKALVDLIREDVGDEVEVVVGIAKAGTPVASLVAEELGCELADYTPRKQKWTGEEYDSLRGSFSRNFADVGGKKCVIVDDVVTSGTTMTEAIRFVEEKNGKPISAAVLANKSNETVIDGVRINSLIQVVPVE
ncbi:MAG: orotate phosphoribosyltransferase-like protein [Halobacteria archaeon]|nr:orotate phosphoribosyltransferase-like protein [Halobacteria archaeon]